MSISTNACRICTLEHLVGANISEEYYSADTWNRCFNSLVESCAPKLAGDYCANSLPDTICITCKQEVLRLHRFVTALLKSDAFFKRGYHSKLNDELQSEENYLMDCHEVKGEMHNEFKCAKQNDESKSDPCNGEENYFIECHNVKNEIHNEVVDTKTEIVYCQVVESKVVSVHPDVATDRDILKTDPFSDNEIPRESQGQTANSLKDVFTANTELRCNICSKQFSSRLDLKLHQLTYRGRNCYKPYVCFVCQNNFSNKQSLRQHVKIHSDSKPYKCDVCGKEFTRQCHFTSHMKTHATDRPYKCRGSSKSFLKACNLRRHELVHLGQKPFECDVCQRLFSQKSKMKTHLLLHYGKRKDQNINK